MGHDSAEISQGWPAGGSPQSSNRPGAFQQTQIRLIQLHLLPLATAASNLPPPLLVSWEPVSPCCPLHPNLRLFVPGALANWHAVSPVDPRISHPRSASQGSSPATTFASPSSPPCSTPHQHCPAGGNSPGPRRGCAAPPAAPPAAGPAGGASGPSPRQRSSRRRPRPLWWRPAATRTPHRHCGDAPAGPPGRLWPSHGLSLHRNSA
mmetsp:Transcript_66104/g.145006  ORF Transcript_66104/g.145006 Transcript_66104/m.145006 type:complete len:207 (-) Transcript_66104:2-622(-)